VKPARRFGLLLAFAALVLQAPVPSIAQVGGVPSDYCSTPGSAAADEAGGGDAGDAGSAAGGCPCCRLHAAHAVAHQPPPLLLHRHAVAAKSHAACDQTPFDAFLAWRELLTQGPPAVC
jgi:hypothetical protein